MDDAPLFSDVWRGRRVLITGHTGFKGAWLTLWLNRLGASVAGVSLQSPASEPNLFDLLGLAEQCEDHRCDITRMEDVAELVELVQPSVIFHLAAQSLVRRGYDQPYATFMTNVAGTANILESVRGYPHVKALVVATSDKCYRNQGDGRSYTEISPLGGNDPYSASKAAAEMVVAGYRGCGELPPTSTVRAGNVIGGGDWAEDRLIPDMARAIEQGSPPRIRKPAAVRPWQHVLDCLAGYIHLARHMIAGSVTADAYNFGPRGQANVTVADIASKFLENDDLPSWTDSSAKPEGEPFEPASLQIDSTLAARDLAWRPVLSTEEAIEMTAAWYTQHRLGRVLLQHDAHLFRLHITSPYREA